MKQYRLYLYLILSILISSCSSKPKNFSEYKSWFTNPENGCIDSVDSEKLSFNLSYISKESLVLNEIGYNEKLSKAEFNKVLATYGKSEYFSLVIGMKDEKDGGDIFRKYSSDYGTYSEMVKYFTYGMTEDFTLIMGEQRIKPSIYHLDRSLDLDLSKQKLIIAFPVEIKEKNISLIFEDKLFGAGLLRFDLNIDKSILPEIPLK